MVHETILVIEDHALFKAGIVSMPESVLGMARRPESSCPGLLL